MNKTLVLAAVCAICVLLLGGTQPLHAQDSSTVRPITTTGEAQVLVAPDEVVLVLGVQTWDKSIQVARKQNDDRIQRITALTKSYGIEPKYVQTDRINVEPRYRDSDYTAQSFVGYFVRKTIVVTMKDVTKFEDFFAAALDAGATHVQGIDFHTTELRKYRDQARAMAIQAAQEKATALAGVLGRQIGKPQSITEDYAGWSSWYSSRWGGSMMQAQNVVQNVSGGSFSDGGTFAPGQISVNARVTVTFALQ